MREVRFRVWDKNEKEMTEWEELKGYMDFGKLICNEYDEYDDFEVMQYVGLKDKYSVEIYEGDYVEFEFSNETRRGFVEFKSGSFQITTKEKIGNQNVSHMFGYSSSRNHKVIGNIFQGEDLLEDYK